MSSNLNRGISVFPHRQTRACVICSVLSPPAGRVEENFVKICHYFTVCAGLMPKKQAAILHFCYNRNLTSIFACFRSNNIMRDEPQSFQRGVSAMKTKKTYKCLVRQDGYRCQTKMNAFYAAHSDLHIKRKNTKRQQSDTLPAAEEASSHSGSATQSA